MVRNLERMPIFAWRVFSDWRARLRADLIFATGFPCPALEEPRIIRARRSIVDGIPENL